MSSNSLQVLAIGATVVGLQREILRLESFFGYAKNIPFDPQIASLSCLSSYQNGKLVNQPIKYSNNLNEIHSEGAKVESSLILVSRITIMIHLQVELTTPFKYA
jgi:hypothetical protein